MQSPNNPYPRRETRDPRHHLTSATKSQRDFQEAEDLHSRILQNRKLTPSFFDSEDSSSDDEGDGEKFRFNEEHTLFVFNAIKDHTKNTLSSARSNYSGKQQYQRQDKNEFLKHLDLIDLRIDPIQPFTLYPGGAG